MLCIDAGRHGFSCTSPCSQFIMEDWHCPDNLKKNASASKRQCWIVPAIWSLCLGLPTGPYLWYGRFTFVVISKMAIFSTGASKSAGRMSLPCNHSKTLVLVSLVLSPSSWWIIKLYLRSTSTSGHMGQLFNQLPNQLPVLKSVVVSS